MDAGSSAEIPSVVFDLDGTLLAGDSTGEWLLLLYRSSTRRFLAGLALAPLAGSLMLWRPSRLLGAALFLWLATLGKDERTLQVSVERFVARVGASSSRLRWRERGLETLRRHVEAGHRVVVVTGAPASLASALLEAQVGAAGVPVIGSSLRRIAGGWGAERHCFGAEKCRCLAEAGYGTSWTFAYSDSVDDAPILERAAHPVLVNGSRAAARALANRGLARLTLATW